MNNVLWRTAEVYKSTSVENHPFNLSATISWMHLESFVFYVHKWMQNTILCHYDASCRLVYWMWMRFPWLLDQFFSGQTTWQQSVDAVSGLLHLLFCAIALRRSGLHARLIFMIQLCHTSLSHGQIHIVGLGALNVFFSWYQFCGHRSMVKLHGCMQILAQKMCVQYIRIMCHAVENCMYDASHQVTRNHAIWTPPSTWPPCSYIFNNIAHAAHWLPQKLA